jgi:hypothetical protein
VVDRAGEHARELGRANTRLERRRQGFHLGHCSGVVFGGAELEEHHGVLEIARQFFDGAELLLDRRAATGDRLGLFLVLPEAGLQRLPLELGDLRLPLRQVKDAPLAP